MRLIIKYKWQSKREKGRVDFEIEVVQSLDKWRTYVHSILLLAKKNLFYHSAELKFFKSITIASET